MQTINEKREFLQGIWGDDPGTRFIASSIPGQEKTFQNFPFETNEKAIEFAASEIEKKKNVFFGVHLFDGKSRKASNAIGCRAFYLDIDVGEGKPYKDKSEAAEAAKEMTDKSGLPEPTIVDSGNGLHLYYFLSHSLNEDLWLRNARQLQAICETQGLKFDSSVNKDRARVLRFPGSSNRKDPADGDSKPCQILLSKPPIDPAEFQAILDKNTPALPCDNASQINDPFLAGINTSSNDAKKIAEKFIHFLNAERCNDYYGWLNTGVLLRNVFDSSDEGLRLWDDWSKAGSDYNPGVCAERWETFGENAAGKALLIGSFVTWCKEDGGERFLAEWGRYNTEKQVEKVVARADAIEMTDYGNAQRLVELAGDQIRYDYARKIWYAWTGTHWKENAEAEVIRFAKATVKAIYIEAGKTSDDNRRPKLAAWAKSSESGGHLREMVRLAESEAEIQVSVSDFDKHPNLLCVENGIIDLKTRNLQPHDRAKMMTHCISIRYEPGAECPIFDAFLDRIFDRNADLIDYVLKALGYSLTAETSEHVLFICYGEGANGKSTLIETVRYILGGMAGAVRTEALMQNKFGGNSSHNDDIASLHGKRFVSAAETESGQHLAESSIKQLTGGDTISASKKYGRAFQFNPFFKLFLAANHKPQISGTDDGIWRRIRLLPFAVRIPESERDQKLKEKLRSEAVGILARLVRSAAEWYASGLGSEPDVISATANYRVEQNSVASYIAECCEVADEFEEVLSNIRFEYDTYCREFGITPMNRNQFPAEMKKMGHDRKKKNSTWVYLRIRKKSAFAASDADSAAFLDTTSLSCVQPLNRLNAIN